MDPARNRRCEGAPQRDFPQPRGEERAGALSPLATKRHAASHAGKGHFSPYTPARRSCVCSCVVAASAHYHEPRYYHRAGPGVSMREDERAPRVPRMKGPPVATVVFGQSHNSLKTLKLGKDHSHRTCTIRAKHSMNPINPPCYKTLVG